VDEFGGSIFAYRPSCKGAEDIAKLKAEVLKRLKQNRLASVL